MIYLDAQLAQTLANRPKNRETGCLEWSRYTGDVTNKGTVLVYAWVQNVARKIGVMTLDGKHGLTITPDGLLTECLCERWQSPSPGFRDDSHLIMDEWRKHAGLAR